MESPTAWTMSDGMWVNLERLIAYKWAKLPVRGGEALVRRGLATRSPRRSGFYTSTAEGRAYYRWYLANKDSEKETS